MRLDGTRDIQYAKSVWSILHSEVEAHILAPLLGRNAGHKANTDTQTHRHTDTQTRRHTDTETQRHRDTHAYIKITHTHMTHMRTYAFCEYVTCAASGGSICDAVHNTSLKTNDEVFSEASPDALRIHGTILNRALNITEPRWAKSVLGILRFWGSCAQETPTAIRDCSVGAETQPGGRLHGYGSGLGPM